MLDLFRFRALTFDCYGTLVDWETGILDALRPVLAAHGVEAGDGELLERYAELESAAEAGAYRPYREVLLEVVDGLGRGLGFTPAAHERAALADSVGDWLPFPDTVEALRTLARRYRLAVVSNVDDDLFERTARRLTVRFDAVVTAARVRAYKPSPLMFEAALGRLDLPRERVLHVAQSLYHDVAPARAAGLSTVWVRRRTARPGSGATPRADARADLEVPDLRTLAALVEQG